MRMSAGFEEIDSLQLFLRDAPIRALLPSSAFPVKGRPAVIGYF